MADEKGGAAAGEGGVGAVDTEATHAVPVVDAIVDGPIALLDGVPPFFFVMGWCVGVLGVRWAVAGASATSYSTRFEREYNANADKRFGIFTNGSNEKDPTLVGVSWLGTEETG